MGLACYYRIFVCKYAQIVEPLTSLLKGDYLRWDKDAKNCFEQFKTLMTSTLLLGAPDFINTFTLEGKLVLGSRMMNTLSTEVTNQIMKLHGRINIFISATHLTNKVFQREITCNNTK